MKKRIFSLALALSLLLSLTVPALAAEEATPVTPTAPEWIGEENYLTFPGDEVYLPENWAEIESMREGARNGDTYPKELWLGDGSWRLEGSVAWHYEVGLIWLKCALNPHKEKTTYDAGDIGQASRHFKLAKEGWYAQNGNQKDAMWYQLDLFRMRAFFASDPAAYQPNLIHEQEDLHKALLELNMTVLDFFSPPCMLPGFSPERQKEIGERLDRYIQNREWPLLFSSPDQVQILLDGQYIVTDVPSLVVQGRTMVPIRAVAEALGATVEWEESTRQVTMTRADTTIVMTVDSPIAAVNGKDMEMDIAPYISDERTLVPARYVAEFFGQKVEWVESTRRVIISEDKSVAGDSNLEAWAIGLGLAYDSRATGTYRPAKPEMPAGLFGLSDPRTAILASQMRASLKRSWGVTCREDLMSLVPRMTAHGHNDSFQEAAAIVNSLTEKELAILLAQSGETDQYMWPYTKELSQRWGDKGILAWDLSRMGAMVQWGYNAGYITYAEALELIEPAARLAQETFTDWNEFYMNYLEGYSWWARNDVNAARETYEEELRAENGGQLPETYETWQALPRASYYQSMVKYLDDALFETGVIGLPEEPEAN